MLTAIAILVAGQTFGAPTARVRPAWIEKAGLRVDRTPISKRPRVAAAFRKERPRLSLSSFAVQAGSAGRVRIGDPFRLPKGTLWRHDRQGSRHRFQSPDGLLIFTTSAAFALQDAAWSRGDRAELEAQKRFLGVTSKVKSKLGPPTSLLRFMSNAEAPRTVAQWKCGDCLVEAELQGPAAGAYRTSFKIRRSSP